MKKNILIILMLISFTSYSQKYDAKKIAFNSANTSIENLDKNEIFSLDKDEFLKLVSKSEKKYNLIVSFATWCSPCRKCLPALIKFAEENEDKINLYIINIEKDKSKNLLESREFFKKINYSTPTFMVSEKYGKDRRTKYKRFIKDLIGEKDFSDIYLGMFENILFDSNSNIILK